MLGHQGRSASENAERVRAAAHWPRAQLWVWVLALPLLSGCAALSPLHGVPSNYFPRELQGDTRSGKRTIDLSLLSQRPPTQYLIDSGDVLGIYIEGVLGKREDVPPVHFPTNNDVAPSLGFPIPVREDGQISLPLIRPITVRGLTVAQVEETIRHAYTVEQHILQAGRERILVSLQRPRTYNVLVIRQEGAGGAETVGAAINGVNIGLSKRGTGKRVSLPAYRNDVLNALAETGGLPGLDAENTIYILRRRRADWCTPTTLAAPHAELRMPLPASATTAASVAFGGTPGRGTGFVPNAPPASPATGPFSLPHAADSGPFPADGVSRPSPLAHEPSREPFRDGEGTVPLSGGGGPAGPALGPVTRNAHPPHGYPTEWRDRGDHGERPLPFGYSTPHVTASATSAATPSPSITTSSPSPNEGDGDTSSVEFPGAATLRSIQAERKTLRTKPRGITGTVAPSSVGPSNIRPIAAEGEEGRLVTASAEASATGQAGLSQFGYGPAAPSLPIPGGHTPVRYAHPTQYVPHTPATSSQTSGTVNGFGYGVPTNPLTGRSAMGFGPPRVNPYSPASTERILPRGAAARPTEAAPTPTHPVTPSAMPSTGSPTPFESGLPNTPLPTGSAHDPFLPRGATPGPSFGTHPGTGTPTLPPTTNFGGHSPAPRPAVAPHGSPAPSHPAFAPTTNFPTPSTLAPNGSPAPGGWNPDILRPQYSSHLRDLLHVYGSDTEVVEIPIRLGPGEMPDFREVDVILQEGDIVFIESRETEVFYTAGLLGGGQFTLPRDYDIDVLQAISIALGRGNGGGQGSAAGFGNHVGGIAAVNQDISVGASDVVILRKVPGGREVPIKIDLKKALRDPKHRVRIMPGDYIVLQYKPLEAVGAFIERNLLAGSLIGLATQGGVGGGGGN